MPPWKFGTAGLSQVADSQGPLVSMQHEAGSVVGGQSSSGVSSVQNYGLSQTRTPMSVPNQHSGGPVVASSHGYTSSQGRLGLGNPGYSTQSQSDSTGGSSGVGAVYQGPAAQTAQDSYSELLSTWVRNPNSGRSFWYGGPFGLPAQLGGEQPVGRVRPRFPFLFPDLSVLNTAGELPPDAVGKMSPLPPSSYIIQSRNGYERAREVMSHSTYTPEDIYPPPYPPMVERPSGMSPPGPPGPPRSPPQVKVGQKVWGFFFLSSIPTCSALVSPWLTVPFALCCRFEHLPPSLKTVV